MDVFGFGTGIKAAIHIYNQSRDTAWQDEMLLSILHYGDRVIFGDIVTADKFSKMAKEKGLENLHLIYSDPRNVLSLQSYEKDNDTRVFYHHSYLMAHYIMLVEMAEDDLIRQSYVLQGKKEQYYQLQHALENGIARPTGTVLPITTT